MKGNFKRILYGGDYNPNQWPKDIWQEDMRIFKDAHINSATVNVFSWAKIQPSEEVYDFSELDEIIEMLSREKYDIVLATSTAALPAWMVKRYPEVARTDYEEDTTSSDSGIMPVQILRFIRSMPGHLQENWQKDAGAISMSLAGILTMNTAGTAIVRIAKKHSGSG